MPTLVVLAYHCHRNLVVIKYLVIMYDKAYGDGGLQGP